MNEETLKWQLSESHKYYNDVVRGLQFDQALVKVPEDHQLRLVNNVTVQKLMNYTVQKLQRLPHQSTDGVVVRGYADESDCKALANAIYTIVQLGEGQVKKDLDMMYKMLVHVVRSYQVFTEEVSAKIKKYDSLKDDFVKQEQVLKEVREMADKQKQNLEFIQKEFEKFVSKVRIEMDWKEPKKDEKQEFVE